MGLEALEIGVVEDLDGGFLDGPVHPLGLAIGPGVVWLGKLVLDSALLADTIEDVGAEVSPGWPVAVLWQVGERHAVVGQHGVHRVGECRDHATQEIRSIHFSGVIAEFDIGELRDAIDRQEHVELALGKPHLADVDVNVADGCFGELASL